jgi:predicted MFS family arabinose efflux permease
MEMTPAIDTASTKSSFLKTKILLGATFLLILALGFNALLTSSSLEKLYAESLASSYRVIGKDLQIKLETALRFGKQVEKFIGMEPLLENTLRNMALQGDLAKIKDGEGVGPPADSGRYVAVALPNGNILYSTREALIGSTLPKRAQIDYSPASQENDLGVTPQYTKNETTYYVMLPIRDREGTWAATAVLAFDETQLKALLNPALVKNVKTGGVILAGGLITLLILLHLVLPQEGKKLIGGTGKIGRDQFKRDNTGFPRKKISIVLFLVIILSQLLFFSFSTTVFKNYYLNITREKASALIRLLRNDVEYLLSKGLHINKLVKMEVMMGKILPALPEVSNITILDTNEDLLYMADKEGIVDYTKPSMEQYLWRPENLPGSAAEYKLRVNIIQDEKPAGVISATISRDVVFSRLQGIIWDSVTVLVISVLFSVELLILIFPFMQQREIAPADEKKIHYGSIRPAAFLFLFGVDISISFVPLHMENLYEPIFGLSKDLLMGLPISVEMFFAGITILSAGAWIDRRGWHEPFLSGLLLSGLGVLYSWLAPNALQFILSRGVVGLGYGLSWMACQGFVISYTDENTKTQGLAQVFAGIMAGSICGGAAGAMLAERIGYYPVFFIGALIIFSVIGYTLILLHGSFRKPTYNTQEQSVVSVKKGQSIKFLLNRNVFSLILLSALPGALAVVGFLYYFSPVYLNRIGTSQSTIGRILMIYGICLIYIAPIISKYADKSLNKKMYVFVSGILGSLAFMIFWLMKGPIATALAILLLGLSSSFGAPRRSYILKVKAARELGPGRTISLFNSFMRAGQVLGPIMFGWLILTTNVATGITYFGIAYFIITLLFLVSAQSDSKITAMEVLEDKGLSADGPQ